MTVGNHPDCACTGCINSDGTCRAVGREELRRALDDRQQRIRRLVRPRPPRASGTDTGDTKGRE